MSVNFTPKADIDGSGNAGFEYQDPNVTGATVTYKFDATFELIGESITYDNGDVFSETVTDNGDGTYTVAGSESTDSGNDTRSYSFIYNTADDTFSSGTETINGNTKAYNSSWTVTSETRDTSALGTALTDAQLTGVPESLKSSLSDGETYSSVETFTGGTETTFYSSMVQFLDMQVHLLKQLAQILIRQLSTVTLLGNLLVIVGQTPMGQAQQVE